MEFTNNIFEKSFSYLDSFIVSIKNNIYDVFMDLQDDDEEEAESNSSLLNETNNSEKFDIEEDLKGPMTIVDELNDDDVVECDEDENLNQHNTAFVLDSSQIDWNDPHDDCEEYPEFLHTHGYSYGSNYDGGYDSY
jgi:hypothetical protein